MKQKIFFTSIISMLVVMPAMAEPSHTDEFPSTGLMQEDYKYTNAATFENTGVYDGSVDAIAEFEYQIGAGEYLPAGADETVDCPAGSFCPGISGNVQYNQSSAQGIQTCPTGYASSTSGASSDTQCYRTCDINNMGTSFTNIAHASAVTGNDYYGSGTDTCEPTACVNGWHIKSGLDLTTAIGTGEGENSAYVDNSGTFRENNYDGQGAKGASYYGLSTSNPNTWAVDYGTNGMLIGQGRCSTRGVANIWYQNNNTFESDHFVSSLTDETGQKGAQYCYCNVTGYTPDGGTLQAVLSPWVFTSDAGGANVCAEYCAYGCANNMRNTNSKNLAFRAALLGSVSPSPAMCEANTITINWSDAAQTDIDANNAGTATYGSDVRTPVKAQTIKGKTFRGWRFSKPEQTNLPE